MEKIKNIKSTPQSHFSSDLYDRRKYKLKAHQTDALNEMLERNTRGNFLWLVTGSGKTLVSLYFLKKMIETDSPKYIIYTLPSEAISSVGDEIKSFGFKIDLVVPIKNILGDYPSYMKIIKPVDIRSGVVTMIEHDYLRKCDEILAEIAPESAVVFDECHKCLNDTLRTGSALDLSRACKKFVAMTGTPVVDNKVYKLINWFDQIYEDIEITEKNFWVGASAMISKLVINNIKVNNIEIVPEFKKAEWEEYKKYVPPVMGGINTYPQNTDFTTAMKLCYKVCDHEIVSTTLKYLKKNKGVHVVSQNKNHTLHLQKLFFENGIKSKDLKILTKKTDSVKLTSEGQEQYKIVISPIYKSSGYDLSTLSVQISSIYPSNQANRTQIKGRINRASQKSPELDYVFVHCGILTRIKENHMKASSLQSALSDLAAHI